MKMSFLCKIIIAYIVAIILFACVDWQIFRYNTTSFLISEQLNKHVDRYGFLDPENLAKYHKDAKDQMPITIDGFSALTKPDFDKLDSINQAIVINSEKNEICKKRLDSLINIASEKRSDSIEVFSGHMLSEFQRRIDSLEAYMADKDSTEMMLKGKYVELANLRYEYAGMNLKVQNYIIDHFGSFIPNGLMVGIREYEEEYLHLTEEAYDLELSRLAMASKINGAVNEFHKNRLETVGFWDFLYYSICISTSMSFGDIAPNNSWTRAIAMVELLFCILLIGIILHKIIKLTEPHKGSKDNL